MAWQELTPDKYATNDPHDAICDGHPAATVKIANVVHPRGTLSSMRYNTHGTFKEDITHT